MMHQMLGTDGGKDSVCTREFLREKMINVCQVCGSKGFNPHLIFDLTNIFDACSITSRWRMWSPQESMPERSNIKRLGNINVYFVRLNKMKMHRRAGTFIFMDPSLKALLFGEL